MKTRFITKGQGSGRKVIPMRPAAAARRYKVQKALVAEDVARLQANRERLVSELGAAKKHMISVMKDAGHTARLLELDTVELKKAKKLVVVAKVRKGRDVFHHVIGEVVLKEKMLEKDFRNIIDSIKAKYHKTIEIWR